MRVGVRELKAWLSEYLARVRGGETLVVADRGKPVARLERVQPSRLPAAVERLAETGALLYKPPPRQLDAPARMSPGDKTSTDYVAEQRR